MAFASIDLERTGVKIKELCANQGITPRQIQEEMHLAGVRAVYKWFDGDTLPSIENLYALAKMLGVPMEEIIVERDTYMSAFRHDELVQKVISWTVEEFAKSPVLRRRYSFFRSPENCLLMQNEKVKRKAACWRPDFEKKD